MSRNEKSRCEHRNTVVSLLVSNGNGGAIGSVRSGSFLIGNANYTDFSGGRRTYVALKAQLNSVRRSAVGKGGTTGPYVALKAQLNSARRNAVGKGGTWSHGRAESPAYSSLSCPFRAHHEGRVCRKPTALRWAELSCPFRAGALLPTTAG
jgi:hypothetical protein